MIRPWGAVLGIGIIRLALCCLPALADASERSQDAVKASFERPIHSSPSRLPSTGRFLSQDEGDQPFLRSGGGGREEHRHHIEVRKRRHRGDTTDEKWVKMHEKLSRELNAADEGKGYNVLFYGDSIFESTQGTFLGSSWSDFRQVKEVWDEVFAGKPYSTHTLAISGDTVKKLLWRMENGEVPLKTEPKVAVVLIGTEDLVSPRCRDPILALKTAAALRGLLTYMHRRMPSTQIVAMGVLPKGQTWPNTCTESITIANKRLQEYAEKHKPWLHYIDLGNRFLTHQDGGQGHQEIVPSLLTQDTLNPSFYGMRIIATELEPLIDKLVAQKPAKVRKAVAHIKPRPVAERVKERAAVRKELAGRRERRRKEALRRQEGRR